MTRWSPLVHYSTQQRLAEPEVLSQLLVGLTRHRLESLEMSARVSSSSRSG